MDKNDNYLLTQTEEIWVRDTISVFYLTILLTLRDKEWWSLHYLIIALVTIVSSQFKCLNDDCLSSDDAMELKIVQTLQNHWLPTTFRVLSATIKVFKSLKRSHEKFEVCWPFLDVSCFKQCCHKRFYPTSSQELDNI